MTPHPIHPARITALRNGPDGAGPVVYWMSRDQRAADNWALLHAQNLALARRAPLAVVFALAPGFLGATLRQYTFMLDGLRETGAALARKRIPFVLLSGNPPETVAAFARRHAVARVVTDFDPLRVKRQWKDTLLAQLDVPVDEVDAHNIVPCRALSPKQEYAAYTFRPRLHRALPEYLTPFPALRAHPVAWPDVLPSVDWDRVRRGLKVDRSVAPVAGSAPGSAAGLQRLDVFLRNGLAGYDSAANNPAVDGQSGLSPYLHFGQVAPQRVALDATAAAVPDAARTTFLEELIVRRELTDNYCWYNRAYDTLENIPDWTRDTFRSHRTDTREHLYTRDALEEARTHDPLWNAAQHEMATAGKMHGYMRMYWAKKILEWTRSPAEAMEYAVYLNDRYELDGRDPNGYVGIAWSVAGIHDRPWPERPVFGKIRYMSDTGCRRKFDVDAYIHKVDTLRR
jgi:deoxyribodipyrimidine photo-lyase